MFICLVVHLFNLVVNYNWNSEISPPSVNIAASVYKRKIFPLLAWLPLRLFFKNKSPLLRKWRVACECRYISSCHFSSPLSGWWMHRPILKHTGTKYFLFLCSAWDNWCLLKHWFDQLFTIYIKKYLHSTLKSP